MLPIPLPATKPSPQEVERIGDEIAVLAARIHAATYHLLIRLREFDRAEGWGGGFASCGHWLSWRTGIERGAAREQVRVARAIEHLPRISEGMRSGTLSYSKVRALTRVATDANEESLMEFALHGTATQVERLVRAWRRVDREEEASQERQRHASRHLSLVPDGDGMYNLRAKLDPEVAMALKRALEAASWALYRHDEEPARDTPAAAWRADAIGLVAECALRGGLAASASANQVEGGDAGRAAATIGRADRYLVVIHADESVLRESAAEGDAVLEDGTRVAAETSRRLACDASRVRMTHGKDGSVLSVGRKTRTVHPALRRTLEHRNGGCSFPGCGSRFCDADHVRHWADGGETRLDNLLLVCRVHHRAIHEEGFQVEMVGGQARFRRPDGAVIPDVPSAPALPADPIEALVQAHAAAGIEIDAWTAAPRGTGERLDLAWAIAMLWRPSREVEELAVEAS